MARPVNLGSGRPAFPSSRNFHSYEDSRTAQGGGDHHPEIIYEGYDIIPKESQPDESYGRWHSAHTKSIPVTQRDLEHLVRKQSLSECTALQMLYDDRMQGSKRAHINSIIKERDTFNPDRKHELAFLKLERDRTQKDSRRSRRKTLSMRIILECKRRPHDRISLATPSPLASQGPASVNGGPPPTKYVSERPLPNTWPSTPVSTPRPQYLPPYARPQAPSGQGSPPNVQGLDSRTSRDRLVPLPTPTSKYDSDDSGYFRSVSPSSTISSDTVRSSGRAPNLALGPKPSSSAIDPRADIKDDDDSYRITVKAPGGRMYESRISKSSAEKVSSSIPNDTRIHTSSVMNQQQISSLEKSPYIGQRHLAAKKQHSYASTGTQTDSDLNISDHMMPGLDNIVASGPKVKLVERGQSESSFVQGRVPSTSSDNKAEVTSIDGSRDEKEHLASRLRREVAISDDYEKPPWMSNMQPVTAPTATESLVDYCGHQFGEASFVANQNSGSDDSLRKSGLGAAIEGEIENRSSGNGLDDSRGSSSPILTPNTSSDQTEDDDTPVREDVTMSEYFSQIPKDAQPAERHNTQPLPSQKPQSQLRRYSDEDSDRSSKQRKRVTFNLPTPPSTVSSTPISGSTPSSPRSSSSRSTDFILPPPTQIVVTHADPKAKTPCRPPLHRSSHSSSYAHSSHSSNPLPPRSSSYRDAPPKGSITRTRHSLDDDTWHPDHQHHSDHYDRRHSDTTTQVKQHHDEVPPALKMFDCRVGRCYSRGSLGFSTSAELHHHMRFVHNKSYSGST